VLSFTPSPDLSLGCGVFSMTSTTEKDSQTTPQDRERSDPLLARIAELERVVALLLRERAPLQVYSTKAIPNRFLDALEHGAFAVSEKG